METPCHRIGKARQDTRRRLDGQHKFHAHFCECHLSYHLTFLIILHQTGLFSSIVAAFLIETYKILLPDNASQTVSLLHQLVSLSNGTAIVPQNIVQQGAMPSLVALRANILMFLSLFFSLTSALVSTLIQQWAREYLQDSQPNATSHTRRQIRTYLFSGLSRFQMRRLAYTVPILLHIAVFLFFFSLSDWLHIINGLVGTTARCCFMALLAVYVTLSILPIIVRNAPYQTPLTTPIRGCISLIRLSYVILLQRSSTRKFSSLFRSIHLDRSLILKKEITKRTLELDRSSMHWLLQKLDEVDMDTFLSCLPGFFLSPDTKQVVDGLGEEVLKRIATHLRICVMSSEHSHEACMSRASAYIKSLRLFSSQPSQIARGSTATLPEHDSITAIIENLASICRVPNSSISLRALCVRGLVIGEFLRPLDRPDAGSDAEELLTKEFPDYLKPIYRFIRFWKTTETAQSSHSIGISQTTSYGPPSDREMWTAVLYDGPLINLAVLANGVLSCSNDEAVNLDIAWKTFETLLKLHGLSQVRVSGQARTWFTDVVDKAHARVSSYERGRAKIGPLIVVSGLRLIEVLTYAPKLLPSQVRAIFGREQLRNSELLEAFSTHLPLHVASSGPELSKSFMEHLILDDKLWEQLDVSLSNCLLPEVPFQDKFRTVTAVFDVLNVTFVVLKDSSKVDWQSPVLDLLFRHLMDFEMAMMIHPDTHVKKIASFRMAFASFQFCHVVLAQFSMQRGLEEPFVVRSLNALSTLVRDLGLGSQKDREYLTAMNTEATPHLIPGVKELDTVLLDGPLSNICKLARLTLDLMQTKASDTKKSLIVMMLVPLRMLPADIPHLPFDKASGEMWARFDDLRDEVRSFPGAIVPDTGVQMDERDQNKEISKLLLKIIEEVERVCPSADMRAEGTERDDIQTGPPASGVVDQDTQQPGDTPISASSRQPAEASPAETRNTMDSRPKIFPLTTGTITTPGNMGRVPPSVWPHSNPDANSGAHQLSTLSIPATQPGPHHPAGFSPSYIPGMRPRLIRRASSLDYGRPLAYARGQLPLGTPDHMYQQSHVPLGAPSSNYPSPDSEYESCMYLCLCHSQR